MKQSWLVKKISTVMMASCLLELLHFVVIIMVPIYFLVTLFILPFASLHNFMKSFPCEHKLKISTPSRPPPPVNICAGAIVAGAASLTLCVLPKANTNGHAIVAIFVAASHLFL